VSCLWQGNYLLTVSLNGFITYLDINNPEKPIRVVKVINTFNYVIIIIMFFDWFLICRIYILMDRDKLNVSIGLTNDHYYCMKIR